MRQVPGTEVFPGERFLLLDSETYETVRCIALQREPDGDVQALVKYKIVDTGEESQIMLSYDDLVNLY